jgi:hypothetical protein
MYVYITWLSRWFDVNLILMHVYSSTCWFIYVVGWIKRKKHTYTKGSCKHRFEQESDTEEYMYKISLFRYKYVSRSDASACPFLWDTFDGQDRNDRE